MSAPLLITAGALGAGLTSCALLHGWQRAMPSGLPRRSVSDLMTEWRFLDPYRRALNRRICGAGLEHRLTADRLILWKGILVMIISILAIPHRSLSTLLLIGLGIFLLPDVWLWLLYRQRGARMARELPLALDVLTLLLESGAEIRVAVVQVVEGLLPGALRDELERLLRDLTLGLPLVEALRRLHRRVDGAELRAFTSLLAQAERWGVALEGALHEQAERMRRDRLARIERAGARASTKILIPILLLIVPAMLLLLVAVLLSSLMPFMNTGITSLT